MATKTQAWGAFADAIGATPATFAKIDRSLLAAGLSPRGGRGGGKNAQHVDAMYLARLVICAGLPLPSEAGEQLRLFSQCRYTSTILQTVVDRTNALMAEGFREAQMHERLLSPYATGQGEPLLDYLSQEIQRWAEADPAERAENAALAASGASAIRLNFEPAISAHVVRGVLVGRETRTVIGIFEPAPEMQRPPPFGGSSGFAPIQRSAAVPCRLLFVAAELLADSLANGSGDLPFPSSGNEPGPASSDHSAPETENAADPARSAALRGDQPRSLATEPASNVGKVCERETPFKGFSSAGGHLPATSSKEAPPYGQPRPHTSVPVAA